MDALTQYLPQHPGLLPKWILLVTVMSIGNSIQSYSTLTYTRRVYSGRSKDPETGKPVSPVNALSARTFGTWTLLAAVVRLYAAYNIEDRRMYELALWTYGIAFAHFAAEWFGFGTARWGPGLAGPALVSTGSLVWMLMQWGFYVK